MAHAYSKLYNIPSTGLRFFTVYGPAGRPDMFYYSATQKLVRGDTIQIFNYGAPLKTQVCWRSEKFCRRSRAKIAGILCVFQGFRNEDMRQKSRCDGGQRFLEVPLCINE